MTESMNIQSAGNYQAERPSLTNVQEPSSKVTDNLSNITSMKALTRAEMTGTKITLGDEQLIRNIERALKAIQGPNTGFEMSVHKATNTISIKVLDKDTGEVIREIPPEKTLDLVAKFMEINGILIDERV